MLFTGAGIAGALLLKLFHMNSTADNLQIVLVPVNFVVELFLQQKSTFLPGEGFYFGDMNVLIDKSCAGVNFFVITLCVLSTLGTGMHARIRWKLIQWCGYLALSYLLTILVNACRIISLACMLQSQPLHILVEASWFHEATGALFYVTGLILITFLVISVNQHICKLYAKLS